MTVGSVPTQSRPIGFWLKLLDRLIEQTLDATLAAERLTRRTWQVLTVVQQGVASSAELEERLQPFLDDTEPTMDRLLRQLRERGWVAPLGDPLALTAEGQTAMVRLQDSVSAARRSLVRNIDRAEYQATVAVLERMAHNLGWCEPSP